MENISDQSLSIHRFMLSADAYAANAKEIDAIPIMGVRQVDALFAIFRDMIHAKDSSSKHDHTAGPAKAFRSADHLAAPNDQSVSSFDCRSLIEACNGHSTRLECELKQEGKFAVAMDRALDGATGVGHTYRR